MSSYREKLLTDRQTGRETDRLTGKTDRKTNGNFIRTSVYGVPTGFDITTRDFVSRFQLSSHDPYFSTKHIIHE